MERERQAKIQQSVGAINNVFSDPKREAQLADYLAAMRGEYHGELDKQKSEADRQSVFALARSGQTGSSLNRDTNTDLAKDYSRGVLNADRLALGSEADLRQSDAEAKNNLLAMAFSGLDATTAARQGTQALSNHLLAGRGKQTADQLGDVFGGFADLYKRSKEQAENRRGLMDYDKLYQSKFAPQPGFTG
jgi:hypothetical protein